MLRQESWTHAAALELWRVVFFPNGRHKRFPLYPRPETSPAPSLKPGIPQASAIENLGLQLYIGQETLRAPCRS
jgi:hypothetical protein